MCSIVGFVGSHDGIPHILQGLERLEYRGYDSAGCAGIVNNAIRVAKQVGGVQELRNMWHCAPFQSSVCLGHTRWATHGTATYVNAHPHTDARNRVAVVHNGIIENEQEIRQLLQDAGYTFQSSTDSELIAHLLDLYCSRYDNVQHALLAVVRHIDGAYAICAITQYAPDTMLVARKGSPICIGYGSDGMMAASDVAGCAVVADYVMYMPDTACALVTRDMLSVYDFDGNTISWDMHPIDHTFIASDKNGYEHYMLKEIYEQKEVIRDTVDWFHHRKHNLEQHIGVSEHGVRSWRCVTIAACGTSYFAGAIGSYYMHEFADMPAYAWIASEFRYRPHFLGHDDCFMVLSQSGETADTLEAMRYVSMSHVHTIGLINVPSSSIEREADGRVFTHAKQEVSVASTKSFTAQVAVMYWLSHYIACIKGKYASSVLDDVYHSLIQAAGYAENRLTHYVPYLQHVVATYCASSAYMIFLGKHIMYPFAQEAALKMQELAYIPSYAYPSGELKHGPLALIRSDIPVVLFSSPDATLYRKILSSAQEVKARGGRLIVFALYGQEELIRLADSVFMFPHVSSSLAPIVMAPVMQAFAYYTAYYLACPIDKPRNLAKSVTVE